MKITVEVAFYAFKLQAFWDALIRGERPEWRAPPPKRALPARWRALAPKLFEACPKIQEVKLEMWGHYSFVREREASQGVVRILEEE